MYENTLPHRQTGKPAWVFAALTNCDASCDAASFQTALEVFSSSGSVANISGSFCQGAVHADVDLVFLNGKRDWSKHFSYDLQVCVCVRVLFL